MYNRGLPGKYMAKLLYGWGEKKYEQEYWKRLEENWQRWKRNPFAKVSRNCNDKGSRDDYLITLNVMRERRELDGVSWWIVLPTYTLFLFVYVYA